MNHFIPLSQAIDMTTLYRQWKDKILSPDFQGKNVLAIAETFDRAAFDTVLAKKDCVQLRIYYGMDSNLKVHAIVVGVNSAGQDILPDNTATTAVATRSVDSTMASTSATTTGTTSDPATTDTTDDIIEDSMRCPPDCGEPSPLNP